MAAAATLGLQYVHIPFIQLRGWESEDADSIPFSDIFSAKPTGTRMHHRRPGSSTWWPLATGPLSKVCQSPDLAESWFRRVERRNLTCCTEYVYVGNVSATINYSALSDAVISLRAICFSHLIESRLPSLTRQNCFDAMYCHPLWPQMWNAVAPSMRRLYRARPKPQPPWLAQVQGTWSTRVVLHVQSRGDRQLRLSPGYYARAVRLLRVEHTRRGEPLPLFRIEGLDGWLDDESEEFVASLQCQLQDTVSSKSSVAALKTPKDVIIGSHNATPLHVILHNLVSSSILVMSRSSLSMAAALLSEGTVIFPRCYQTVKRPLPEWRLLPCSRSNDLTPTPSCHRQRVVMDDAEWLRTALSLVSPAAKKVCEVNTRDGAAGGALLAQLPSARFFGFAMGNSVNEQPRLNAAIDAIPSLHKRRTLFFGDQMNTVRAKPQFNGCDVMIVSTRFEIGTGVSKAVVADLPNILQRMAAGDSGNVIVMHGLGVCDPGSTEDWCTTWREMVARRLITVPSCSADGPYGHGWCVGRVPTDSSCSTRLPLLPALTTRLAGAAANRSSHLVPATCNHPWPRAATAYEDDGWHAHQVGGVQLEWERYFTVVRCDGGTAPTRTLPARADVCLVFKNHIFESWVGMVSSNDDGRSFAAEPTLVLPTTWQVARLTHNLALTRDDDGRYLAVGGQFKVNGAARCGKHVGNSIPCHGSLPDYNGLWFAQSNELHFVQRGAPQISTRLSTSDLARRSDAVNAAGQSSWANGAHWIFNGTHPGCVERRTRQFASMARLGSCEFDGRLSLVRFRGELRLYARANPAMHGQRYVQTVASVDGGATWGRFQFVSVEQYDFAHGDIYFFAVSANPVHNDSLLALYPLVHKFRGCVAISASADGLRWSAPTPLLSCAVHGERTVHHPAQGFVHEKESVSFYVHENVPGTTSDVAVLGKKLDFHPYLRLPPSRLVRYTMPAQELLQWTRVALASIS